jgi:hypothetical protein
MRTPIISSLLLVPALAVGAGVQFEGRWEGRLDIPGRDTPIVLDLAPQSTGALAGSLILPGLGIKGAPLSNIVATDSDVAFDLGNVLSAPDYGPARFRMRLDGGGLAGEMSQGGNVAKMALRKIGPAQVDAGPRSTPVARALEDQWSGEFELGGYPRQVTITLQNHPEGAATATFVVVGKRVNNLPVDLVVEEGRFVRIESATTRVSFEGRLFEDSDELKGTIELGPFERPLALRRSPRRAS